MIKKMFKTNKFLLIIIVAVSFGMVSQAHALLIGDTNYLGSINDGVPASPDFEAGFINNLITLAIGATDMVIGTETYNRVGSTLAGPFPMADASSMDLYLKQDNSNTSFAASGFEYVLAKYDQEKAGSLVWYMAGGFTDSVMLPSTYNGQGLSHTIAFSPTNGGGNPVPEPATMLLLGFGLSGILLIPRKKLKKR
jgi:hypothetical protein